MKRARTKPLKTRVYANELELAPSLAVRHRQPIIIGVLSLAVIALFSALIFRSSALTNQFIPLNLGEDTTLTGDAEPAIDINAAGGSYIRFVASPTPDPPTSGEDGSCNLPGLTYVNCDLIPARATMSPPRNPPVFDSDPVAWWSGQRIWNSGVMPIANDENGSFRTDCHFSHISRDDPLVYPGLEGRAHLHTFWGNVTTDYKTDVENLVDSNAAATCGGGGGSNRSAYWVPSMIDTRDGRPLIPARIEIYYKTGEHGIEASSVKPFPKGLRMIAGNANSTGAQEMIWYSCYSLDNGIQRIRFITDVSCPTGDRMITHIDFPQCWDGMNTHSADNQSHMAYPVNGKCPSSHSVPLTNITFKVYYDVPPEGTSTWRLASDINGAPAGSSGHGDWINGWNEEILNMWVQNCNNTGLDCRGSENLGNGMALCQYTWGTPTVSSCRE